MLHLPAVSDLDAALTKTKLLQVAPRTLQPKAGQVQAGLGAITFVPTSTLSSVRIEMAPEFVALTTSLLQVFDLIPTEITTFYGVYDL